MPELLAQIIRNIVDNPAEVRVVPVNTERALVMSVTVAPDDVGKVIGKQGRIARALRSIVRASGARAEERYLLEIAD